MADTYTLHIAGLTRELPICKVNDHMDIAQQGGEVAHNARLELEAKTGKRVISPLNAKSGILLKGKSENISKEGSEDELKD